MKRLLSLLGFTVLSVALALPATVTASVRLRAKPADNAPIVTTLAAKAVLEVKSCSGGAKGWCLVTANGRTGFLKRAVVKASGNCAALRAVGLGDLVRGEASYNGQRDRDGDGLGCDKATP